MATHSSILAWRTPWTEEPGGLQSMGLQESDTTVTKPPAGRSRQGAATTVRHWAVTGCSWASDPST